MLDEERFLSRNIFIFEDKIILEVTGAAQKVDRPEVYVIRGRAGVEDVLDKLPPHTVNIAFKSDGVSILILTMLEVLHYNVLRKERELRNGF